MVRLFIDADACPVRREAERVAERHGLAVFVVSNGGIRPSPSPLVETVIVAEGPDAADLWIAERAGPGDICITQDVPLAARCLEAGAMALRPRRRGLHPGQHRQRAGHAGPHGGHPGGQSAGGRRRRAGLRQGRPLALPRLPGAAGAAAKRATLTLHGGQDPRHVGDHPDFGDQSRLPCERSPGLRSAGHCWSARSRGIRPYGWPSPWKRMVTLSPSNSRSRTLCWISGKAAWVGRM